MAKIEFEAFIESWSKNTDQHPAWGMKTAETHRRKLDDGSYETTARSFRTVKVSRGSGIDLTEFAKGDRVSVWGKETTEVREHEGKKYYDVVVWADRVEVAEKGAGLTSGATASLPEPDPWAPTSPEPSQGGYGAPGDEPF